MECFLLLSALWLKYILQYTYVQKLTLATQNQAIYLENLIYIATHTDYLRKNMKNATHYTAMHVQGC